MSMIPEWAIGTNPFHRMVNRATTKLWERQWRLNYEVNKLALPASVSLDSLICEDPQAIAVVAGAGPSLDENLAELSGLVGADFFCTDKAYPKVVEYLDPKYVLAAHPKSPDDVQKWWNAGDTTKSTLIMPLIADPIYLKDWKGSYCLFNGSTPTTLTQQIINETGLEPINMGYNVGFLGYLLAPRLGYNRVVLLGMDFSFRTREEARNQQDGDFYLIIEYPEKDGKPRWANWGWFDTTIAFFEYARFFAKRGVKTYNCTNGGIIYDGEYIEEMTVKEAEVALRKPWTG